MNEREQYVKDLLKQVPDAIVPKQATLVLAQSWTMLKTIVPALRARFGDAAVLVQGDTSMGALLATHKAHVAEGKGSILVGVATMAEGLDLPGNLCEHVMVLALPFSVPTTPLEQEIAERLGNRYFGERSLPMATAKLQQMAGRLLRQESDRGRITVFDRRLSSTSYGRQMMDVLPPFKRIIEPVKS